MTARDPKEINRLKQARRNALLNLAATRMGYDAWSNLEREFASALSALGDNAVEAQVNKTIKEILSRAAGRVPIPSSASPDKELAAIFEKIPPLRKWRYKA